MIAGFLAFISEYIIKRELFEKKWKVWEERIDYPQNTFSFELFSNNKHKLKDNLFSLI